MSSDSSDSKSRSGFATRVIHAGQALLPLKMRSFVEFAAPRLRKALIGAD